MPDFDTVVVGAGVVGLACARSLARSGRSVLVLERHERFGVETSSRNSEVIHAGLYYQPGSLKAELCIRGAAALYAYCAARDVPHRRIGKLVVANGADEESTLASILELARQNGAAGVVPLSTGDLARLEPHVRATAALWSPDTGIVDSHALMAAFAADAEEAGAAFAFHHTFLGARRAPAGYRLRVRGPDGEQTVTASGVVNAAGLDADTVAAGAAFDLDACGYRQHWARGHYFRIHPRKAHLARHLIYPTPIAGGLGVHVTLDLAGGLKLGPDVEWLAERAQDYAVPPDRVALFHAAATRYLDGLQLEDLTPDQAGIRAKLQAPGAPARDFVIAEETERGMPGWVNLIGIESPGLTACLAIADQAAQHLMNTGRAEASGSSA